MLSITGILSKTQQGLDVFEYYIPGISRKIGKAFLSPLREEKKPSFNIFQDPKSGKYCFKDFGTNQTGDVFEFVKLKEGIDEFNEVLEFVSTQILGSQSGSNAQNPIHNASNDSKKAVSYVIEFKDQIDQMYWHKYGISGEILELYHVRQVEKYIKSENGKEKTRSFHNDLCFAYHVNGGTKLYLPHMKTKFMHCNKPQGAYVFGYDQLPERGNRLFLTGGEKDVMSLYSLGESAISFNSETCNVDQELITELKERFMSIIVLYDKDETGRIISDKICKEFDLINANIGSDYIGKDISDYKTEGLTKEQFKRLIAEQIEVHYKSILKKLEPYRFDINKTVIRPIPIIRHGDNSILSIGNLTAILGKVKTGKSAFIYEILTKAFRHDQSDQGALAFGYAVEPIDKKSIILHFETEQSEYDWHKRLKSIVKGQPDLDRFISYSLTKFAPKERMGMILQIAYYHLIRGVNIHLLAIDGIADLVDSVNDEVECNTLIYKLHSLSTTYKISILTVLHLNPDGSKSRGHLGSQLDRKAESVLIVERDKDAPFSYIKARYTRNADMFQMPIETFQWDDFKKRHVYTGELGDEQKANKDAEMLIDFVTYVFDKDNTSMPKSNFITELGEYFKIKNSQQYRYLERLRALGLILEENKQIKISDSIKGQL